MRGWLATERAPAIVANQCLLCGLLLLRPAFPLSLGDSGAARGGDMPFLGGCRRGGGSAGRAMKRIAGKKRLYLFKALNLGVDFQKYLVRFHVDSLA